MQTLKQIGPKRVLKHIVFVFWQAIFNFLGFSPLRVFWLKLFGAQIGQNSIVDKIDFVNLDRKGLRGLSVGSHCFLGRGALLDLADKITLKDHVIISPRVSIFSHMSVGLKTHPLYKKYPPQLKSVIINRGCFIGASTTILCGVTLNENSVIGAGSLINKNIPKNKLAAGNPVKIIR